MTRRPLLALACALALADASIVTLALPPILVELDGTVEGVAAVLGVYTLVLTVCLPGGVALRRRVGSPGAGAAGLVLFAAASLACGLADSLTALTVLRGAQAAGAAVALVACFALLEAGAPGAGRRLWVAAAVFGTAVGPALGGALTQLFDWRAIFFVQAPIAAAAAIAAGTARRVEPPSVAPLRWPPRAGVALALVSAALTGVLFLLVLLLINGWSLTPLEAAAIVSVLPVAALAGSLIKGAPWARASAGCFLVAGGVTALAFVPGDEVAWVILPQIAAGVGMGLALPALAGELLPERTPSEVAASLGARHAGITLALLMLAPLTSAQLDKAVTDTREKGAALLLDAALPPLEKVELVNSLLADLDPLDPRESLERELAANARIFADDPEDRAEYARLRRRADETLVAAIDDAFAPGFLLTGALALVAALASAPVARREIAVAGAAAVAALALPLFTALRHDEAAPEPVTIADPCQPREYPRTGGITGFLQEQLLVALDRAACNFGSSREELALALVDDDAREDYQEEHGRDPRDAVGLLGGLLGGGG